jgi:hypothetical protein
MVNQRGGGEKALIKYLEKESVNSREYFRLDKFIISKSAKVKWFLRKDNNEFGMYKDLGDFLRMYAMKVHMENYDYAPRYGRDYAREFYKEEEKNLNRYVEEHKRLPPDDDLKEMYRLYTNEDEKEEVVKETAVQIKSAKKRCPKGTRKNKAGHCVKNKETGTQKRCPKGSRKNKAGDCVKKTDI